MPVAAREASIYTGLTLGEYYRQMGISTLLIADSTSRWAQALREMSARLEEIPGEEAFPAYLDSAIKNLYERAGLYRTCDGSIGALTMVGTVSPAGGNFEEPVTQSTLATVKCFLGLSYNRAYKRFYPAIEPLISWSRYLKQMENYFRTERHDDWVDNVQDCIQLLKDGDSINQMMQVSGEEGISMSDYIKFQKSLFIDMVYLQQDAFDSIEAYTSPERQKDMFIFVNDILGRTYKFVDKKEVLNFFTQITGLFKNMNYTEYQSERFNGFRKQIEEIVSDMTA
jgi:V/A-type H+-transporting ATPase subunit A